MWEWLTEHMNWTQVLLGVLIFLATFAFSLAEVTIILVKLPANYFQDPHARNFWRNRRPAIRWLGIILKNALGVLHILAGIVLSFPGIPGQGILTILIGVMMLDLPGVRRFERWLVSRPRILRAIDRLRARYGKPPLVLGQIQSPEQGR